jgi:hypothetical protein
MITLQFLKRVPGYLEGRTYEVPTGAALIYLKRKVAVRVASEESRSNKTGKTKRRSPQ